MVQFIASLILIFLMSGVGYLFAAQRAVSLIITGGVIVTMDDDRRVLTTGAIAIAGDGIVAIGSPDRVQKDYISADTIEASGQIVLPGLINTHTHAPMVMYRGLADDLALMDWLEQYILPAEAKTVTPEFVRVGTKLALLEMIRSGTTTYADMYYFEDVIAEATHEAGMRAVLGQTVIRFPAPDAATPSEALERASQLIERWQEHELITPAVAPHAMFTLDRKMLEASHALSRRHKVPLLIHLAETRDEVEIAQQQYSQTPTEYLDEIGFWSANTVAAHGIWVSKEDIAVLEKNEVGVSHNPESNMKLASGTAPVSSYLAAGVAVGLGTDGAASNNNLDMFEAMRFAALLHKLIDNDPRAVGAEVALEMATIGGAKVLGLEDQVGSLEVGKRADLIVVSMDAARQTPMYNPISHLVYTTYGDDVVTTIVNGRVLMRDKDVLTLDEDVVISEARAMATKVLEAIGVREPE